MSTKPTNPGKPPGWADTPVGGVYVDDAERVTDYAGAVIAGSPRWTAAEFFADAAAATPVVFVVARQQYDDILAGLLLGGTGADAADALGYGAYGGVWRVIDFVHDGAQRYGTDLDLINRVTANLVSEAGAQ